MLRGHRLRVMIPINIDRRKILPPIEVDMKYVMEYLF